MNKDEALALALNALHTKGEHHPRVYAAIAAIQTVLAQPVQEPVEPVGYVNGTYAGRLIYNTINPAVCLPVGMALYIVPLLMPESLTEKEIEAIGDQVANEKLVGRVPDFRVRFARAIEAKLKDAISAYRELNKGSDTLPVND